MNTCPVYRHITGHGYGSIYPGPMGMVLTPLLVGYDNIGKTLNACTLCSACADVCPLKIPLNSYILDHRNDYVEQGHSSGLEAFVFDAASRFLGSRGLYGVLLGVGGAGTKLLGGPKGYLGAKTWVPILKSWTAARDLPELPRAFRKQFAEHEPVPALMHPQPKAGVVAASGEEAEGGEA